MSTNKGSWEKIAEQEQLSNKKEKVKENLDIAAETTGNVAWLVWLLGIAVIMAVVAIFKFIIFK